MSERTEYLRGLVEWLTESEITGYEIEKETGVARTTISQLRKGDANIDNITLVKAEKLAEYAETKKEVIDFYMSCLDKKWSEIDEKSKKRLLENANCINGIDSSEVIEGDCIVDFNDTLSISGKMVNGEIAIEDNATIYAPSDIPLWWW